jgi:hypothetical protein
LALSFLTAISRLSFYAAGLFATTSTARSKRAHASGSSSTSGIFPLEAFAMTSKSSGIDNDYKLALGSLVYEVSKLDSKVTELIAALTEMDISFALILVHHQQFANKVDSLRALFRLLYTDDKDPQYQPIKDALDRTKTAGEFRNSVVHCLWRVDEDTGVPHTVRIQARGELTHSEQPAPVEKIRQFALEAIELAGTLGSLAKVYRGYAKAGLGS